MAFVRKKNKVLSVTDNAVASYLAEGYDEIDKTGKVIKEATAGKTITVEEHNKVIAENETLKKENETLKKENDSLKKVNAGKDKPADDKKADDKKETKK